MRGGKREHKYGRPDAAVPLDIVEAMFLAYCKKQTALFVASQCLVSSHTAGKYIERGDPSRGVEPFKARFRKLFEQAQKLANNSLAKATAEQLALVRGYRAVLTGKVLSLGGNPAGLKTGSLGTEIEKTVKMERVLLGEPDQKIEVTKAPLDLGDLVTDLRLLPEEDRKKLREALE